MPKRCILEDLCEGDGEILRTRCERRLRTKGERLMQYRNAYHEERFRKILDSGKWEDRTMLFSFCGYIQYIVPPEEILSGKGR